MGSDGQTRTAVAVSSYNFKQKLILNSAPGRREKCSRITFQRVCTCARNATINCLTATKVAEEEKIQTQVLECCEKTLANEGKKCCKSKSKNMVDSGLSQVQLDVAQGLGKDRKMTRHEARFGITSFIYYSRRPFHPGRLGDLFLEPYFCDMPWLDDEDEDEDEDEEGEEKEKSEEEKKEEEEKKKKAEEEK